MQGARRWRGCLGQTPPREGIECLEGRRGQATLRVDGVLMHSLYQPKEEAQRLLDSADLDPQRPVLVIGLGLAYHVLELLARGYTVAAVEADPEVARLALEGDLGGTEILVGIGTPEDIASEPAFRAFAADSPQCLIHPPTARLHPGFVEGIQARLASSALAGQHLSVAIVGPMFGGSLPIAGYLANAFRSLGHRTLELSNHQAWDLYQEASTGVKDPNASAQLGRLLTHFLSEWNYARTAEFNPEICIVLAQAPVGPDFPLRLAKQGIVTAFWYVENWRHLPSWKEIAPNYDYFFHIQPGEFEQKLDEIGCRHHAFVQTGCDPDLHRPLVLDESDAEAYSCDLSFAGAGYYNRVQLFKGLTDYRFNIWGVNWNDPALAKKVVGGERRFDSDEFMKIVAGSKINLNLHSSTMHEGVDPNGDAINPRVFEIAAAGGFQLCDPCIGLERHFDFDTELPVYRDLKELRAKIDYYLAHPGERAEIAQRARERALRDHTYEHRARQMLDLLFDAHGGRLLQRGIRVQRTIGEMVERIGRDTELGRWLATLPPGELFSPETIPAHLINTPVWKHRPAQIFTYLQEVRESAEAMIREYRG